MDLRGPLVLAEALLVAATLALERAHASALAQAIAKGAASACFVALGVLARAPDAVLAALALGLVGDVLLVPKDARAFRAGIVAFLLAHVALVVAFAQRDPAWLVAAGALVPLALAAILVGRWLLPQVHAQMRRAVVAYMLVITIMVAMAAGASAGRGPGWLVVAALAFWANDVLVARERFVTHAAWHRIVGLPAYYAAMTAFALSG